MPRNDFVPINSVDGFVGVNQVEDPMVSASPAPSPSNWWNDFTKRLAEQINNHNMVINAQSNPTGQFVTAATDVAQGQVLPPGYNQGNETLPSGDEYIGSTSSTENDGIQDAINEALEGSNSLSDWLRAHPGASPEQAMKYMAEHSDEWAEKYMDYLMDKQAINEQNAYTASREDTAYQRLVSDLKKAGLNPAMMYGSSAGTAASGSVGHASMSSGANSRSISNYDKIKKLLLAYMYFNLDSFKSVTNLQNSVFGFLANIL